MTKYFLLLSLLTILVSCNSTSSIAEMPNYFSNKKKIDVNFFAERVNVIESYISNIDYRSKQTNDFNTEMLNIKGNKRILTGNESTKKVILKNNAIVKVSYLECLKDNLLNSKEFYYNNNSLVCIKLNHIMVNKLSHSVLNQRIIYIEDEKPISDSDKFNASVSSNELVSIGINHLKTEYTLLN